MIEAWSLLLIRLIKWTVILFVGGSAAIIILRLLTGQVNTRYLLWGRRSDGTLYFSAERVQLLVATVWISMQFLLTASRTSSGEMPEIPTGALELLGASHAVYLGGKGWMMLRKIAEKGVSDGL